MGACYNQVTLNIKARLQLLTCLLFIKNKTTGVIEYQSRISALY